jgi:hypothetical protein
VDRATLILLLLRRRRGGVIGGTDLFIVTQAPTLFLITQGGARLKTL